MTGIVFPELPLNTEGIYTSSTDKSGCIIYIPAISIERAKVQQEALQNFLNNQPPPPKELA